MISFSKPACQKLRNEYQHALGVQHGDVGGVKHFVDQKGAADALKGRCLYDIHTILISFSPSVGIWYGMVYNARNLFCRADVL